MLNTRIEKLQNPGILPVVRLKSGNHLSALLSAFQAGGIVSIELTMTMPDAVGQLKQVRQEFGSRLQIGMGTILRLSDARKSLDAGAEFLVSPVPIPGLADLAHQYQVPVVMGAFTPAEAFAAYESGADFVKIFPLNLATPKYLKTLLEPFPFLKLIPSGGITGQILPEIFSNGAAACCVGGELVRKDLIAAQNWDAITEVAKTFVSMAAARRG